MIVGSHVDRFEILGELGAGGMGRLYRARDPRLGREVAIKVLSERLDAVMKIADRLLIPLQPSLFDIQATAPCWPCPHTPAIARA